MSRMLVSQLTTNDHNHISMNKLRDVEKFVSDHLAASLIPAYIGPRPLCLLWHSLLL